MDGIWGALPLPTRRRRTASKASLPPERGSGRGSGRSLFLSWLMSPPSDPLLRIEEDALEEAGIGDDPRDGIGGGVPEVVGPGELVLRGYGVEIRVFAAFSTCGGCWEARSWRRKVGSASGNSSESCSTASASFSPL